MKRGFIFCCILSFAAISTILSACSTSDDEQSGTNQTIPENDVPVVDDPAALDSTGSVIKNGDFSQFSSVKDIQIVKNGEIDFSASQFDNRFNSDKKYLDVACKTDFALNLAKLVGGEEQNYFISPLSVQMAFALLANGAEGNTYDEIVNAIGLDGLSKEQMMEYNKLVLTHYSDASYNDTMSTMQIANSVWASEDFPVYESYYSSAKNYFDAEPYCIDFSADDAADAVNYWAEMHTNGKVKNVVDKKISHCVMLLLNAIYMKTPWVSPFEEGMTERKVFNNIDGSKKECDMMQEARSCAYYSDEKYSVASIGLSNMCSMSFFLPNEGVDLNTVIAELSAEKMKEILSNRNGKLLDLQVPKFQLGSDLSLNDIMNALGINDAFSEKMANFQALSPTSAFVSMVKHNTYLDVNEKGVEAAAVTSIGIEASGIDDDINMPAPIPFHLDHPFFFTIHDMQTGAVIFVGRVQSLS